MKQKGVVAFLEYYCIEFGGNLLIHVEVREQRQETKKSSCIRRSLDMVRPTKLKRLKYKSARLQCVLKSMHAVGLLWRLLSRICLHAMGSAESEFVER